MTQPIADIEPTTRLDTSGLLCPLPVYKAALALDAIRSGEVLELTCTDPGSLADIPVLARRRGDTLLGVQDDDGKHVFWIRKGAGA